MRNLVLAAVAAFALASSMAAPTFAATHDQRTSSETSSSNVDNNCASILANGHGHSAHDRQYCASKQ